MSDSSSDHEPRRLATALVRGARGRCPKCGQGKLLAGYIAPMPRCAACGEHLAPYLTADFAPYVVTFAVGLIFTPLIAVLAISGMTSFWTPILVCLAALSSALVLLPRAKGMAIALLWALDVSSNV